MLDGLNPETCRIAAMNRNVWVPPHQGARDVESYGLLRWVRSFQLVEYGCDGVDQYVIDRRDIDLGGRGVQEEDLERALGQANYALRQQARCTCVHRGDEEF